MAETEEEANGDGYLQSSEVVNIGILLGRGELKGMCALKWAMENNIVRQGCVLYLLHVMQPLRCINSPMGAGKFPVDQVHPRQVKRAEDNCLLYAQKLSTGYIKICRENKINFKLCYSENDSIKKGIVEQISKLGIKTLILENCSHSSFTRSLRPESISAYVSRHAPAFCTVMVVRSRKLHSGREVTCTPSHSPLHILEHEIAEQEIVEHEIADDERQPRRHQETQIEFETQRRAADLARQQAQAKNSRFEEALSEVTKKLEEEYQLRKEAEERASQQAILTQEAIVALGKEEQYKYTKYSFQEIQLATNNFHEENKLGEGSYGPVYKGKLHHTTVAIKVLAREGSQGRGQFEKEVEVLSRIHHPHIVMLIGACPEKGCIVYEYMANGSLEDRLKCRGGTCPLPWYVRFRICLEVAIALLFLHSRPERIVHRDLKPGNILLDHHFVSKISDVGIAKLIPIDFTSTLSIPKGTFGYMDPSYASTCNVGHQSDVYALGIVMLQLLTGRGPVGVVDVVKAAVDKNQLEEVLDKSAGKWPLTEATVLARVSLQCTELERKNRPNLETKILPELESVQASIAHNRSSSSSRTPMILSFIWRCHRFHYIPFADCLLLKDFGEARLMGCKLFAQEVSDIFPL